MKKILLLAAGIAALTASAADGNRKATLRAEYDYQYAEVRSDSLMFSNDRMALQMAPGQASRFFSIKTEFYDSINATPGGPEMIRQQMMDALNNSGGITRDADGNITSISIKQGVMNSVPTRGITMNVTKDFATGKVETIDMIKGPDHNLYSFTSSLDELNWEPTDSTTEIFGYECQQAVADYHGRRWTVWYAPEIPVSDGPWQLAGLPGLILKAESDGGEYSFTVTALYECNEPINGIPGDPAIEKTTREEYYKLLLDTTKNPGKLFGITNGSEIPVKRDFIETDYH